MSIHSINQYLNELEKIIHFGGTKKETAIRNAFYNLLNEYARQKDLMIVTEVEIKAANSNRRIMPDGTLKDILRQDWGYWESKDESDNINAEIQKKFERGYPRENILFEDSRTAVLIQNGYEVNRVTMNDAEALDKLLKAFVSFERPEVRTFRKAIENFKEDIPKVTETIRGIIEDAENNNPSYNQAADEFLKLCHASINPDINIDDVREMIIQHILTEDIFNTIFDENQFHRENNIARELEKVIHTFFTGASKRAALASIKHYYDVINAAAAGIADHHEKQKFLKVVYETFYKSYNPKAADRLGVVYTPNEVVKFMIESTDYLLYTHFNKFLSDKDVDILDPATGTGTFICDIIDYIRKDKLEYKYRNELHANEVAILPYYISNLNIEFTYMQKTGKYAEFKNLCFVDTLDNIGGLHEKVSGIKSKYKVQGDLFAMSTENSQRIIDQNRKKISVIIGNPPYNANQANENDNNKNREYPIIDQRIKDTFIKQSTAQKTKVYDMYARFYRWAFDRLEDNGIISFITNRSFIESRTFDGFRKTVMSEFDSAYIIDTKSDVRANPKIAGTTHNVFGIQTGVAIMFLIKKAKRENKSCKIHYISLDDFWRKEQKLQWLASNPLKQIPFEILRPDKNNNWINIADNDFETLLPLADKSVKLGRSNKAIFELYTLGVVTARDEWVYDFDEVKLKDKVKFLIEVYNNDVQKHGGKTKNEIKDSVDYSIKWTRAVKNDLSKKILYSFNENIIVKSLYRPYIKKRLYFNKELNEMRYQLPKCFAKPNIVITISGTSTTKPFSSLVTDTPFCYDLIEKTQSLPLYQFNEFGEQISNVTDWGFNQFVKQYGKKGITKESIFYYVYAVLHNPEYRKKYELNLKREFPRIPFYDDFNKWSEWGKKLVDLHINYEKVEPYELEIIERIYDVDNPETLARLEKAKLKAYKEQGRIELDGFTTITGIPKEAWEYKLGNRSALEWILDQYKESKPKDPTIAEKFNTYKFGDYKDQVTDLIKRVTTVSVKTMKIIIEMIKN